MKETASFYIKRYREVEHYHCRFCGEVFRPGDDVGLIRYNHSQLDFCPYCVDYASQPGLPQWVLNHAERVAAR